MKERLIQKKKTVVAVIFFLMSVVFCCMPALAADGTFLNAYPIAMDDAYHSYTVNPGEIKWHTFTLTEASSVSLEVFTAKAKVQIHLCYDSASNSYWNCGVSMNESEKISECMLPQGRYYVSVKGDIYSSQANYSIRMSVKKKGYLCPLNDDSNPVKLDISKPVSISGVVASYVNPTDTYCFTAPVTGTYSFVTSWGGNMRSYSVSWDLYDAVSGLKMSCKGSNGNYTYDLVQGKSYKLIAQIKYGNYAYNITITPPEVKNDSPSVTDSSSKNPVSPSLTASLSKNTVKRSKLKKKAVTVQITSTSRNSKAIYSYTLKSCPRRGQKYVTIYSNGVVKLKKKAPKGTYKIRVTVEEGNGYKAEEKILNIVVR